MEVEILLKYNIATKNIYCDTIYNMYTLLTYNLAVLTNIHCGTMYNIHCYNITSQLETTSSRSFCLIMYAKLFPSGFMPSQVWLSFLEIPSLDCFLLGSICSVCIHPFIYSHLVARIM